MLSASPAPLSPRGACVNHCTKLWFLCCQLPASPAPLFPSYFMCVNSCRQLSSNSTISKMCLCTIVKVSVLSVFSFSSSTIFKLFFCENTSYTTFYMFVLSKMLLALANPQSPSCVCCRFLCCKVYRHLWAVMVAKLLAPLQVLFCGFCILAPPGQQGSTWTMLSANHSGFFFASSSSFYVISSSSPNKHSK